MNIWQSYSWERNIKCKTRICLVDIMFLSACCTCVSKLIWKTKINLQGNLVGVLNILKTFIVVFNFKRLVIKDRTVFQVWIVNWMVDCFTKSQQRKPQFEDTKNGYIHFNK